MAHFYLDKYGVLHGSDKLTAEKYSQNGKTIESDIRITQGYPAYEGKDKTGKPALRPVIVYGVNECYKDGNRNKGKKENTEKAFLELAELYSKLS